MLPSQMEISVYELRNLVTGRAIEGETMLLNMGPQHPSTHGVLRLLLELDGEKVVNCVPDIGFLHTGIEKNMEAKPYMQSLVMTDRMDYLNTVGNNLLYSLAIEKLVELDVPPRAQAIRVILVELQRIASHLVWLGTHALDLAAMSVFLYCFRERELILDILEMCSGQRMMTSYIRPGGLWRDVPQGFEEAVQQFVHMLPGRIAQYESMLTRNPLFLDRTRKIGVISAEQAVRWGLTGPPLRATGIPLDLRKAQPYSGYEQYEFDVPTAHNGDVYDRYIVRMEEMRQSLRIIEQALEQMPEGPVLPEKLPRRLRVPPGEVYMRTENPRGEYGIYLVSKGGEKPYRLKIRASCFCNLMALKKMTVGHYVADAVTILGSVDIVLGEVDR